MQNQWKSLNNIPKGKKGQFVLIVDLLMIALLTIALIGLSGKYAKICPNGNCAIGEEQMKIFGHAAEAEKAKLFLDKAAPYAYSQAVVDTLAIGGTAYSNCGTLGGVAVYYDDSKNCIPSREEIEKTLEQNFGYKIGAYGQQYESIKHYVSFPRSFDLQFGITTIAESKDALQIAGKEYAGSFQGSGECGEAVVKAALSKVGSSYSQSSGHLSSLDENRNIFDCSGLVYWAYGQVGYKEQFPLMTSVEQAQWAIREENKGVQIIETIGRGAQLNQNVINKLQKGDVIFFRGSNPHPPTTMNIGHVGIYIGDGKYVHAAGTSYGVIISKLEKKIGRGINDGGSFRGAMRICKDSGSTGASSLLSGDVHVMIDPGHGTAHNTGTPGEDAYNWMMASKLKTALKTLGINSKLTHTQGEDLGKTNTLDNQERARRANKEKVRLLFRIHMDYEGGKSAMYYPGQHQDISIRTESAQAANTIWNKVYPSIASSLSISNINKDIIDEYRIANPNKLLKESKASEVPVVLIEVVPLNTQGKKLMNDESFTDHVADAMAQGISEYLRNNIQGQPSTGYKSARTSKTTGFITAAGEDLTSKTSRKDSDLRDFEKRLKQKGYNAYVEEWADKFKVDKALIMTIIARENFGLNPDAVSSSGKHYGLMQIGIDKTTDPVCQQTCGMTPNKEADAKDPRKNICCGTNYAKVQMERFDNKLDLVFIAYNAGPGIAEDMKKAINNGIITDETTYENELLTSITKRLGSVLNPQHKLEKETKPYIKEGLRYYEFFGGSIDAMQGDSLIGDAPVIISEKVKLRINADYSVFSEVAEAGVEVRNVKQRFIACLKTGGTSDSALDEKECESQAGATEAHYDGQTGKYDVLITRETSFYDAIKNENAKINAGLIIKNTIAPPKPPIVEATYDETHKTIKLRWGKNYASDVVKHIITCEGNGAEAKTKEISGNGGTITTATCPEAYQQDATYTFSVKAVDDQGNEGEAESTTITIPNPTTPSTSTSTSTPTAPTPSSTGDIGSSGGLLAPGSTPNWAN